jgi:hypothetical protein
MAGDTRITSVHQSHQLTLRSTITIISRPDCIKTYAMTKGQGLIFPVKTWLIS